ncbi:MAG: hypothetical protein K2P81_00100 [Bacteriovoracaceae bacterium]|nr:hypothetical protein [Bacteriovoracaceae bacterium]
MKIETGKKIYRTSMIAPLRLVLLGLVAFFFHDLYLGTFQEDKFLSAGAFRLLDVARFHLKYPAEFIWLSTLSLPPFLYYAFIRGVRFYEKGYRFNKGIPFLNSWHKYEDIKQYKLLAPKSTLAVFTNSGDIQLVVDGNIERVIAILDQHGAKGDLTQDAYVKLVQNLRNFCLLVIAFTMVLYAALKMGWFRFIH